MGVPVCWYPQPAQATRFLAEALGLWLVRLAPLPRPLPGHGELAVFSVKANMPAVAPVLQLRRPDTMLGGASERRGRGPGRG